MSFKCNQHRDDEWWSLILSWNKLNYLIVFLKIVYIPMIIVFHLYNFSYSVLYKEKCQDFWFFSLQSNSLLFQVPLEVFDYIDAGRNPQLFTKDCMEKAHSKNEEVKGKINAYRYVVGLVSHSIFYKKNK